MVVARAQPSWGNEMVDDNGAQWIEKNILKYLKKYLKKILHN